MIPDDVCGKYFTASRVYETGTHCIRCFCCSILDTTETHIVGIERRIVFRIVLCPDRIFKSGIFKSYIPVFDTLFYCVSPFFGESGIYIKYDRFAGFYQLSFQVVVHFIFFRFQSPSVNNGEWNYFVFGRCIKIFIGTEKSYPKVM